MLTESYCIVDEYKIKPKPRTERGMAEFQCRIDDEEFKIDVKVVVRRFGSWEAAIERLKKLKIKK